MKLFLAMIFVMSTLSPVWGGWVPSNEVRKNIVQAMYFNDDRESVYQLLKSNLEQGMDVESPHPDLKHSLLTKFATIEWYREDGRSEGRQFTDWDQKIFDLLIRYGANVNYSWSTGGISRSNVLLEAVHRWNLDMVKKLIKAGANPKVSFPTGNFNLRNNVLIGPVRYYDGAMFSYLHKLTNFPINGLDYCSAYDERPVPDDDWQREVLETLIKPASKDYDRQKCLKLLGL